MIASSHCATALPSRVGMVLYRVFAAPKQPLLEAKRPGVGMRASESSQENSKRVTLCTPLGKDSESRLRSEQLKLTSPSEKLLHIQFAPLYHCHDLVLLSAKSWRQGECHRPCSCQTCFVGVQNFCVLLPLSGLDGVYYTLQEALERALPFRCRTPQACDAHSPKIGPPEHEGKGTPTVESGCGVSPSYPGDSQFLFCFATCLFDLRSLCRR